MEANWKFGRLYLKWCEAQTCGTRGLECQAKASEPKRSSIFNFICCYIYMAIKGRKSDNSKLKRSISVESEKIWIKKTNAVVYDNFAYL